MSDMKYLDFDLAIEPSGQNYTARVFNSPVGQASADFTPPFSDLEIENFLLRVGRSRHTVRRIESPEMASAKAFGGRLFNDVFAGDVRGCLRSSLDEASRQGVGLRVRLHLGKVPALADLPWEYLYNSGMNRFLGLSVETPLVRYIELPERIRPLSVKPPLRVLMMISSPSDYPQLDVSRESAKMTEALSALEQRGLVVVERQEHATLAELQRRLRQGQFHIFHFIGHGGFDDQAQDGVLILEDQEERGRRVSAQFLGTLLHDHRPLRLAVLNACEGARASRSDPFAGTAQSLVQQGIPAVIAMQFEVTDEAAICFTREFYAAIAVGYPVDAALAEARKAIFAEVSEIEWGTPVLYMRSPDGRIFDVAQVSDQDRQQLYISSLLTAAMAADGSGDEPTAVHKLREVLALDPNHAAAADRLREITRQQEVTALYTAARTAYDAGRWREALDQLRRVQAIDRAYRDVESLIARAEGELTKAAGDEDRHRRVAGLRRAAADAMAAGRWEAAVDGWQSLAASEPDDQEARAQLSEARRQRDLATLYARGRAHYERRHWRDALAELHQVQQAAAGYRDTAALIADIEGELRRAADKERDDPRHRAPGVREAGTVPLGVMDSGKAAPGRANWFVMGGVLGAVVIVGILVVVVALVVLATQNSAPAKESESASLEFVSPPASISPATTDVPPPPARTVAPEAKTPAPAQMTAALQEVLKAAIQRGDEAEILAYRTLNPQPFYGAYAGDLLAQHLAQLQVVAASGAVAINTLVNQQFHDFKVSPDGQRAEVRLTERWSTNFVAPQTNQCVSHFHEHDVPQTAHLQMTSGGWRVYRSQQEAEAPELAPCH